MLPQQPLLTNPPAEFIQTRLDKDFHPAFDQQGIVFDPAQQKFVLKPDNSNFPPEKYMKTPVVQ